MCKFPLTFALGTDAGVRLLRELARHGGQLSAPELVRRTGLAKASVARGLEVLGGFGIAEAAGTNRSVLYRLRQDHPLAPAMSALFEAEEARFQAILDSIRKAAESARLVALWLFGSVARGEDRTDSDLDLALVAEPEALPRLADALRDGLVGPSETMRFTPSVVSLGTNDVTRWRPNATHGGPVSSGMPYLWSEDAPRSWR